MIDATLIVRTVQDSRLYQWSNRHRGLVLFGVAFVVCVPSCTGPSQSTEAPLAQSQAEAQATTDAEIVTNTPDINQAYLHFQPLPKDFLLQKKDYQAERSEIHRQLMDATEYWSEAELLYVPSPFDTSTPRGDAVVFGVVYKRKDSSGKWIVFDETWFFRGGKLIAEFPTSYFGKQGAIWWCHWQEEIHRIYGNELSGKPA